jgi:cellulose synthase/poly-beta-1,6-N-acetylglucosamine synthase-like glycosyltransferase
MLTLSAIFFALYLLLVAASFRLPHPLQGRLAAGVTVVVAFRNEEGRLGPCLERLLQSLNHAQVPGEVLAIDDHSTDHGAQEAQQLNDSRLLVLTAQSHGKKAALAEAVAHARYPVVAFTDADTLVDLTWVQRMAHGSHGFTAGWVQWCGKEGWLTDLQRAEGLAVMQMTAASFAWGVPLSANGASLAVPLALAQRPLPNQRASGDDVGRLQLAQAAGLPVQMDVQARVQTPVAESLFDWWEQRKRWASKTAGGQLTSARVVGLVLLLGNLSWVLALWANPGVGLLLFLLKSLLDALLVWRAAQLEGSAFPWRGLAILEPFYPLYLLWLGLVAPFLTYRWKGRSAR